MSRLIYDIYIRRNNEENLYSLSGILPVLGHELVVEEGLDRHPLPWVLFQCFLYEILGCHRHLIRKRKVTLNHIKCTFMMLFMVSFRLIW